MDKNIYEITEEDGVITPQLVYYLDIVKKNTEEVIRVAGSPERLWPHVKTHKSLDMVKLLISMGIHRFKCATIPECEMVAMAGATDAVLAYPLVGPNIERFLALQKMYPDCAFYAIGDDHGAIKALSDKAVENDSEVRFLLDVNMGMNRTGIELDKAEDLARYAASLPGLSFRGMHCYDGNHNNSHFQKRLESVKETDDKVDAIKASLEKNGIDCSIMIMGGTPSFPCHAKLTDYYLSPGTCFVYDGGYKKNLPDINLTPAGILMTRVISHPAKGMFTIDLGYKGIASDPAGVRGTIVGLEEAEVAFQSEEHWVFRMKEGQEDKCPEIGKMLYVIPTHICPTSALYSDILIAENGKIADKWPVTARNRKINI